MAHPEEAESLCETETVRGADAEFETLMLGLRLNEGVSAAAFRHSHGISLETRFGAVLEKLCAQGLLLWDGERLRLTRRGQDVQNSVLVELMPD